MKNGKFKIALALFLVFSTLSGTALATHYAPQPDGVVSGPSVAPRSIDTSFDLDFSEHTSWTMDFDNNVSWPLFDHAKTKITYNSNTPSNQSGLVWVELHIDEDGDGTYEIYDPDGGYTFSLKCGGVVSFDLPYWTDVKNYRIVLRNRTTSVTSGNFSIQTF